MSDFLASALDTLSTSCHVGTNGLWCSASSSPFMLLAWLMLCCSTRLGRFIGGNATGRLFRGGRCLCGTPTSDRHASAVAQVGSTCAGRQSTGCACRRRLRHYASAGRAMSWNAGVSVSVKPYPAHGSAVATTWGAMAARWSGGQSIQRLTNAARLWWLVTERERRAKLRTCSVAACNSSRQPIEVLSESYGLRLGTGQSTLARRFYA